jgi:hypothetical protein
MDLHIKIGNKFILDLQQTLNKQDQRIDLVTIVQNALALYSWAVDQSINQKRVIVSSDASGNDVIAINVLGAPTISKPTNEDSKITTTVKPV